MTISSFNVQAVTCKSATVVGEGHAHKGGPASGCITLGCVQIPLFCSSCFMVMFDGNRLRAAVLMLVAT